MKASRNSLYTMWLKSSFGSVGEGTVFSRPLRIEGGGSKRITIGDNVFFNPNCILGCWERYGEYEFQPKISIGNNCFFGEFCHITAVNSITIGDGLLTGHFVYIGDNSHGGFSWEEADVPPVKRRLQSKGPIRIGNNVWIGDKVTILGGVSIGDNVIIAANSVVLTDVPSNSVVAGAPAEIKKRLN